MKHPNILVPTDFSEPSKKALRVASQWVRAFGGQVTPLHAYEAITDLDGFHFHGPHESVVGDLITVEAAIRRQLDESAGREVDAESVQKGIVVMGHPARVIAQASADHDLVIIASHGRSGLSRFFLGSVTDKVIRLCPVPVLVVGDEAALLPLERILVPTDLSVNSESAFPLAREIADATGAIIELLYVRVCEDAEVVAADALEKRVRAFAGRHFEGVRGGIEVSAVVTGASAHEEIYRWVQAKKCNLIVMGTAGKSGTDHVLLGSTPAQVVREVETAVLSVKPEHYRGLKLAALEPE